MAGDAARALRRRLFFRRRSRFRPCASPVLEAAAQTGAI